MKKMAEGFTVSKYNDQELLFKDKNTGFVLCFQLNKKNLKSFSCSRSLI